MSYTREATPQKFAVLQARELIAGDRFYFASDKKKIPYQVTQRKWKKLCYISAAVADRNWSEQKLIEWSSECNYSREVIFIRNVNDNNNESNKEVVQ